MANLEKLNFPALSLDGENYLAWSLDVRANLIAKSMLHAIVTIPLTAGEAAPPDPTPAEEARVLVYIRRHLHPYLRIQSLHLVNPREL
jgi:hypothetical protein